jgi:hypothetical protein
MPSSCWKSPKIVCFAGGLKFGVAEASELLIYKSEPTGLLRVTNRVREERDGPVATIDTKGSKQTFAAPCTNVCSADILYPIDRLGQKPCLA